MTTIASLLYQSPAWWDTPPRRTECPSRRLHNYSGDLQEIGKNDWSLHVLLQWPLSTSHFLFVTRHPPVLKVLIVIIFVNSKFPKCLFSLWSTVLPTFILLFQLQPGHLFSSSLFQRHFKYGSRRLANISTAYAIAMCIRVQEFGEVRPAFT